MRDRRLSSLEILSFTAWILTFSKWASTKRTSCIVWSLFPRSTSICLNLWSSPWRILSLASWPDFHTDLIKEEQEHENGKERRTSVWQSSGLPAEWRATTYLQLVHQGSLLLIYSMIDCINVLVELHALLWVRQKRIIQIFGPDIFCVRNSLLVCRVPLIFQPLEGTFECLEFRAVYSG